MPDLQAITIAVSGGRPAEGSRRTPFVMAWPSPTRDLTWSTAWRPNVRVAERFRVGRVFIAGDGAHVHPPTGGQNLNTGVQDAYNLGWRLADGREEVLATYETERRTNAERVLGISEDLLQKHVEGDESALERGENTRQLDVSYRDPSDTRPIGPGDRAPDAPLLDASGNKLRLFELFRGPHETLLRFSPTTPRATHRPSTSAATAVRRTRPRKPSPTTTRPTVTRS